MKQTITVTPSVEKSKERTYPYMGISAGGNLVWFVRPSHGISLGQGCGTTDLSGWNESNFTPFTGTLTFNVEA